MLFSSCSAQSPAKIEVKEEIEAYYHNDQITVGAERMDTYLPMLRGKRVGLIVNQTSMVNDKHLADVLITMKVNVVKIFAPEHGFRGEADAGETVKDGIDVTTNLPVISLYGKNKKPSPEQIADIDVLVFDIQDVGARFYTYISTMHYVMEAAAENGKAVIILDRPNPNGFYVAGPVMEDAHKSFVGMHPVPIVHGMTVGEYAQMINGEGWLKDSLECPLAVIPCVGYDHTKYYELPIKPSPNLPNMRSIYLYPTFCLLEGTDMNVGRGTTKQFQVIGSPNMTDKRLDMLHNGLQATYTYVPEKMPGAKYPKHEGKTCKGFDWSDFNEESIRNLKAIDYEYIRGIYQIHGKPDIFFNDFFTKLAGNTTLQQLIMSSPVMGTEDPRIQYARDMDAFMKIRAKYLLYDDF